MTDKRIFRDYFGADAEELRLKKLFLFDMDGTVYKEDMLFDGARDLMRRIEEIGGRYVFITNNSSKSAPDYVKKVNRLGIECGLDNFFTSSQAAALYIKDKHPLSKVYCQGTISLMEELREAGINVTDKVEPDVEVVLVGFDTELTSAKLRNTCELLQRDVAYIATNPDLACPVSFGFIPDCGSICMMLENAVKKKPFFIGKPSPTMVDIVMARSAVREKETVVIGDRLYTDIATGLNAGVTTVCVLTGEATAKEIKSSEIKPTYTFNGVKEIYEILATGEKRL